eukprot:scaffold178_cov255-Pinguiococcus_pyrenoidosus.AAC.17
MICGPLASTTPTWPGFTARRVSGSTIFTEVAVHGPRGDHGRRLREAIPDQQLEIGHAEELLDAPGERAAAAEHHFDLAAEARPDLLPDQEVPQLRARIGHGGDQRGCHALEEAGLLRADHDAAHLPPAAVVHPGDRGKHCYKRFADAPLLPELLLGALVDRLEEPRDGDQELRLVVQKIPLEVADVRVDHLHAARQGPVLRRALEDVPAGKDGDEGLAHHGVARAQGLVVVERVLVHLAHEVAVLENDALGLGRRAARVHQRGGHVVGHGHRLARHLRQHEFVVGHDLRPLRDVRFLGNGISALVSGIQHDHEARRLARLAEEAAAISEELVQQLRGLHHGGHRLGVLVDVPKLVDRRGHAAHCVAASGQHDALLDHEPAVAVLREHAHALARAQAEALHAPGRDLHLLPKFGESQAGRRRVDLVHQRRLLPDEAGQGRPHLRQGLPLERAHIHALAVHQGRRRQRSRRRGPLRRQRGRADLQRSARQRPRRREGRRRAHERREAEHAQHPVPVPQLNRAYAQVKVKLRAAARLEPAGPDTAPGRIWSQRS